MAYQTTDKHENVVVYRTSDYEKFKFMPKKNRKVNQEHTRKLQKKMEENGFSRLRPITVFEHKGSLYVSSGQHRLTAARNAGVDLYYTVIDKQDEDESVLIDHNFGFKDWSDDDRLARFASLKKRSYVILYDLIKSYDFLTVNTALMFLTGLDHGSKEDNKPATGKPLIKHNGKVFFIEGELKISIAQRKQALEDIEIVAQLIDRREQDHHAHAHKKSFLTALLLMIRHPDLDMKKFCKAIDASEIGLTSQGSWRETLERMVLLYNGKMSKKNRIDFPEIFAVLNKTRARQRYGKV